jgi:hypothetical protein
MTERGKNSMDRRAKVKRTEEILTPTQLKKLAERMERRWKAVTRRHAELVREFDRHALSVQITANAKELRPQLEIIDARERDRLIARFEFWMQKTKEIGRSRYERVRQTATF